MTTKPLNDRASRPGRETRQRQQVIRARVTPEEFDKITADAQAVDLSVGGYLRFLGMRMITPGTQRAAPLPAAQDLARIVAGLSKIGCNLNQLTKLANQGQIVPPSALNASIAEVRALTNEICDAFFDEKRPD
jgi:hypothetical protein